MRGLRLLRDVVRVLDSALFREEDRVTEGADASGGVPPSQGSPEPMDTPAPLNLSAPAGIRGRVYRTPTGELRLLDAIFRIPGGRSYVYVFTDARRMHALDAVRVDSLDGYLCLDIADLALDPTLRLRLPEALRAAG